MKIETEQVKEVDYNKIVDEKLNIKPGDILLIKNNKLGVWIAQFVTLITSTGIYLHSDNEALDDAGIILWPKYIEEQNLDANKLYNDNMFIHIPIKEEDTFVDWCEKCKENTEHISVDEHDKLEDHSYVACTICGNRYYETSLPPYRKPYIQV